MDQTPLLTRYQLLTISFQSGATSGPPYQVFGSGVYQVGGEVALVQELVLNTQISNAFTSINAVCVSSNTMVLQAWPKIQIQVDETNGTPVQVYHLGLVAVPVPRFCSITPDLQTGDVLLQWESNEGMVQLERARDLGGPYASLGPIGTNTSFIDSGILIKSSRFFYRLRPF